MVFQRRFGLGRMCKALFHSLFLLHFHLHQQSYRHRAAALVESQDSVQTVCQPETPLECLSGTPTAGYEVS